MQTLRFWPWIGCASEGKTGSIPDLYHKNRIAFIFAPEGTAPMLKHAQLRDLSMLASAAFTDIDGRSRIVSRSAIKLLLSGCSMTLMMLTSLSSKNVPAVAYWGHIHGVHLLT
jgi:hypothetical protein